ncbi:MAG: sulfur carrier protein ThiS [Actinomycetales bacterium]
MKITVNADTHDLAPGTTCRDLVATLTGTDVGADGLGPDGRGLGIAVAVNGEVVPRSTWQATALAEGAEVEIVTAVQGG